jgi:hypothetical protein
VDVIEVKSSMVVTGCWEEKVEGGKRKAGQWILSFREMSVRISGLLVDITMTIDNDIVL